MIVSVIWIVIIGFFLYWFFGESLESFSKSQINAEIENALYKTEQQIENSLFDSVFEPVKEDDDKHNWRSEPMPSMAISDEQIQSLLSIESLKGPYGLKLLKIPNMPTLPSILLNSSNDAYDERIKKIKKRIEHIRSKLAADLEKANKLKEAYNLNDQHAIEEISKLTLIRHALPKLFQGKIEVSYESDSRVILVVLEIPDLSSISIVKQKETKYRHQWISVAAGVQKKLKEDILYSLCIRAGYLVANSDANNNIDLIAINIRQKWFDPATGAPKEGFIASLQATKNDFMSLQMDRIAPKACFRHLKGISTPSIENAVAIKPIFDFNMDDRRIVKGRDVSESLDPNANLAEMPWDDFEHLVRQLFEWEFGREGIEVKVTCASRDRGVDAIMFDPNPLKGGKYVLQAKRYNRTVDVAAVRDLYGTVVNEGANRGILVTTSSYGPDTYEFAKGKPISLVDGQHLVQMLKEHGKNYHIKLEK